MIFGFCICACIQEELHDCSVASVAREDERCFAALPSRTKQRKKCDKVDGNRKQNL
jgi:hypothetical protein